MARHPSNNLILFLFTGVFLLFTHADLLGQNRQTVEDKELVNAQSSYIEGLAAFENENYQQALELLKGAYVKLPEHPGVNFALADAYFMINDLANAAYYGKQAVKLDPENQWYHLKLSDIYHENGKRKAAIDQLNAALEYHPNNTELLYELAQSYSDFGKLREANKMYNKILFLRGDDISIRLQKLKHFNRLNMQDSAITELQKIRDLDPNNLSTMQVLSNQYLKMDKLEEAKEVLQNALQIKSGDSQTLMMLSDIYLREAQWDSAGKLLENVMTDSTVAPQEKLKMARFLYSEFSDDTSNAELKKNTGAVLQKLMEAQPQSGQTQSLAADFFVQTNQNKLALEALEKTISLTPTDDSAWRQRLQLLLTEGKTEEAIEIGEQAANEIPQDPIILYFLGSAHLSNQNYATAIEYLEESVELPVRQQLKSSIFAALGNSHAALENWDKAFQNYEESLKINPQNAGVLNNYAYYLSLQKTKLQKAEELAQKALNLDPENPSYLDTLGWIYYQMEEYDQAEKYIRSALKNGGATAEIMEHMGNVFDKLDEPEKARDWWQKALQKDSSRTHLKDKISEEVE